MKQQTNNREEIMMREQSCYPRQPVRVYTLSDLIDIVEELHATVRALPEGCKLDGIRREFVLERLWFIWIGLWFF